MTEDYRGPATPDRPNSQPIEKLVRGKVDTLAVHSIFHTIQGEGPFCGRPAVFVRLAGCNLQCPWCDTEYSAKREDLTPEQIVASVAALPMKRHGGLVVITGGEPFRQDLRLLTRSLVYRGYQVQIETNGTLPPTVPPSLVERRADPSKPGIYIVCSPKAGRVHVDTVQMACCYKYVLDSFHYNPEDGLPTHALGHPANPQLARPPDFYDGPIYLQPADHQDPVKNKINQDLVVNSAMKHGYIVQLQIHKILSME